MYGFIFEESVPPACACGTGKNTTRLDSMQKMESLQEDEKRCARKLLGYLLLVFICYGGFIISFFPIFWISRISPEKRDRFKSRRQKPIDKPQPQ